ncbi:MAG: alpha/beta hydrolase [Anaerolineae bacterium]
MSSEQRFRRMAIRGSAVALGTAGLFAWLAGQQLTRRPDPDAYTNPGALGLPSDPVSFPSRDGVTLRGWFIPKEDARGAIIFCPGHTGSVHSDLACAPWLHQAGYALLMFDWRGRGRSDGAATSLGILERRDLLGAIDFLGQRGAERVGLMGFSMGGAVAVATSPMSESVAAIVSDGAFARVRDVVVSGMVWRGMPPAIASLVSRPIIWAASLQLGVDFTLIDPIRWADFCRAPLLMIHGQRDPFVPPWAAYQLYHAAREPKELWMVPEAGHRNIHELRPQEYRDRVVGFFDRWLGG